MSYLSPEELYERFKNGVIDKASIINHLTSYIESSEKEELRIKSCKILNKLKPRSVEVFEFLEHLFISDMNPQIKRSAVSLIINNYIDKALEPLKWLIHQHMSLRIMLEIEKYLININAEKAKKLLAQLIAELLKNDKDIVPQALCDHYSSLSLDNLINLNIQELIDIIFELKYPAYITEVCKQHSCDEHSWYVIVGGHVSEIQFNGYEGNDLNEVALLYRLKHLEKVSFSQCGIKTIKDLGLNSLLHLKHLEFFDEAISEINGLEGCVNLKKLIFYNTGISEISGLEGLTNLEELRIERNYLTEIKGLEGLYKLKILNLKSNRITEFKGCEDLESLVYLNLEDNQIERIHGLEYFQELKEVNLKANPIKEINKNRAFKIIL